MKIGLERKETTEGWPSGLALKVVAGENVCDSQGYVSEKQGNIVASLLDKQFARGQLQVESDVDFVACLTFQGMKKISAHRDRLQMQLVTHN